MKTFKIWLIIFLGILLIPLLVNFYVVYKGQQKIMKVASIQDNYDIGLVLGCGVKSDGTPSKMLKDRLDKALELYAQGLIKYILLSGEHGDNYSEVDVMVNYLKEHKLNDEVIIRDNVGFSTSQSLENYQANYASQKVIIITQEYHLYRALYLAQKFSLKAIGVPAKKVNYSGQILRNVREIFARNKDFWKYLFN